MSIPCKAGCQRRFNTIGSMHKHLTSSTKCSGYLEGKLRDIGLFDDDLTTLDAPVTEAEWDDDEAQALPYEAFEFEPLNHGINEFHFLPLDPAPENEADDDGADQGPIAGPGPSTAAHILQRQAAQQGRTFDDQSDPRVTIWTEAAGHIIRRVPPPVYTHTDLRDEDEDIRMAEDHSPFFPFSSELDWKIAQWAIKDGPGHKAFDRLLEIPGVVEKLGLSFRNIRALHQLVDAIPERAGQWQMRHLSFKDSPEDIYTIRFRNPLEAIKSLWRDADLSPTMVFRPAKMYSDEEKKSKLPRGATLAPVIIATDKTQLTQFSGSKTAYPVYLTIGNIPKAIHRRPSKKACILIGYLSVDKINRKDMTDRAYRARIQRLFHESMRTILEPLMKAGHEGVEMVSSDGAVRLVFPILLCYVADYPEQCLVTCTKYGTCTKCKAKAAELQHPEPKDPCTQTWTEGVLRSAQSVAGQDSRAFYDHCMEQEVSGSIPRPFWTGFPLCDIHNAITPDVLHQLYQGVLKHLISWCQRILSPEELDKRVRCLPPGFGLRHFKNRISALSQISGPERKNMAKILLGCLVGSIPGNGVAAITALLDFIYIAQYPSHNTDILELLQDALNRFNSHRDYFIDTGIREDFNIPKFHSLLHYVEAIKLFGTTDNYNTETFERLHIDFAKLGWRASNQRDEFPQMICWLSRREKIANFEAHQKSIQPADMPNPADNSSGAKILPTRIMLAKTPNYPGQDFGYIHDKHDAPDFEYYLRLYLNRFTAHPVVQRRLNEIPLSFTKVDIYNMFRFHPERIQDDEEEKDLVKAIPKSSKLPHGRFNTVVVVVNDQAQSTGLKGTRIGCVKVIFALPQKLDTPLGPRDLPSTWPQGPLAFVEWYSPLAGAAQEGNGMMYRIRRQWNSQRQPGAIIPLANIRQSCMLFPVFPRDGVPPEWTTENILDLCDAFHVNNWLSKYSYQTLY